MAMIKKRGDKSKRVFRFNRRGTSGKRKSPKRSGEKIAEKKRNCRGPQKVERRTISSCGPGKKKGLTCLRGGFFGGETSTWLKK